jgi:hypothetical protein
MKLTKARLNKIFLQQRQTRKKLNNKKVLTHTNTFRNKKQFNLRSNTIRNYSK